MDFINSRVSNIEREQQRRREEAKRKLQNERRLAEEQRLRELKLAEDARIKKIENERLEEERVALEQQELIESAGIRVSAKCLIPYEIEGNDDKVILSENILNELTTQDAYSKGPMYFKIVGTLKNKSSGEVISKTSHVGVREFTADPKSIGLPRKVLDSLIPSDQYELTETSIKYVRLPKCSYVKLQPKANDFFSVGPVKLCLEENLRLHSTLTVGDVLTVWYRGKSHILTVSDMKPDNKGSLIDSDVEVDLDVSEEFKSTSSDTIPPVTPLASQSTQRYHRLTESTVNEIGNDKSNDNAMHEELDIPPEPGPEVPLLNQIAIKVKTSTVGTITRRFLPTNSVSSLFHVVSQATKQDIKRLQLSTRFPTRTLTYANVKSEDTYERLGITSQETFMLSIVQ